MLYALFTPIAPRRWGMRSRSKQVAEVAFGRDGSVTVSTKNASPEELATILVFAEQHGRRSA
jgi:hypothetical protein